jgi:PKD repeat protein
MYVKPFVVGALSLLSGSHIFIHPMTTVIQAEPIADPVPVGSNVTVTASVFDFDGQIVEGISVTMVAGAGGQVSGTNVTAANGSACFEIHADGILASEGGFIPIIFSTGGPGYAFSSARLMVPVVTVSDVTDPVADAGEYDEVSFGTTTTLDGSGSSDDFGIVEYIWTFTDGSAVELTGETVDHQFGSPGVYVVTLTVSDAAGNSDVDTAEITVVDDEAPVADAGDDQTGVIAGDTVTLDGSGSSDNAGIEEYAWSFTDGTDVTLYGATVEYVFSVVGEHVVTLTVTDDAGLSDTDTLVVTVAASNEAPAADAGLDVSASEGETIEFDGSGSTDDASVDLLTYVWTFEYDGEVVNLTGTQTEFIFDIAGTYDVTLNVTDAEGLWDTDTVTVTVEEHGSTLLADYWWAFAGTAIIVAAIVVLLMLMKGGIVGRRK